MQLRKSFVLSQFHASITWASDLLVYFSMVIHPRRNGDRSKVNLGRSRSDCKTEPRLLTPMCHHGSLACHSVLDELALRDRRHLRTLALVRQFLQNRSDIFVILFQNMSFACHKVLILLTCWKVCKN